MKTTNLRLILCLLVILDSATMFGQGANNIVISEVMTSNASSIEDDYGHREAWVELANISYTTYDIRGMYLTTNRAVLNKSLSAPQRITMMSVIPSGDHRTLLQGQEHLLFFGNSDPSQGLLHLALPVDSLSPLFIALYNANGVDLIDSVTIPILHADESYARVNDAWQRCAGSAVTPGHANSHGSTSDKIAKFKDNDPHGFAMAFMAMGIVFLCLALLWIFFTIFGMVMRHMETARKMAYKQPIKPITKTVEKTAELGRKTSNILQEGLDKKGIDMEIYMAVIGMALRQYEDDVHDVESGIITIKPKETGWDDEYPQMTHLHNPFLPTSHQAPDIPKYPD